MVHNGLGLGATHYLDPFDPADYVSNIDCSV
jgi:hypothetical protein